MPSEFSTSGAHAVHKSLDLDGDGFVNRSEFAEFLFQSAPAGFRAASRSGGGSDASVGRHPSCSEAAAQPRRRGSRHRHRGGERSLGRRRTARDARSHTLRRSIGAGVAGPMQPPAEASSRGQRSRRGRFRPRAGQRRRRKAGATADSAGPPAHARSLTWARFAGASLCAVARVRP